MNRPALRLIYSRNYFIFRVPPRNIKYIHILAQSVNVTFALFCLTVMSASSEQMSGENQNQQVSGELFILAAAA